MVVRVRRLLPISLARVHIRQLHPLQMAFVQVVLQNNTNDS
jgi:hypothetical protein